MSKKKHKAKKEASRQERQEGPKNRGGRLSSGFERGPEREYELLVGIHREGRGEDEVIYDANNGDTVVSTLPLDKMFANKFRPLGGKARRPRDLDETLDESGHVMDKPLGTEDEDDLVGINARRGVKNQTAKMKKTRPSDAFYADEDEEDTEAADQDEEVADEAEETPKKSKKKKKKG